MGFLPGIAKVKVGRHVLQAGPWQQREDV